MLMGLAPPTSGTIYLLGLPMPERGLEIKQLIGLVPDESLLFDHLTGGEFIEFVGRIYGLDRAVARERAQELLELFELDGNRTQTDHRIFQGHAQARGDGGGADPSAAAVPDG